MSGQLIVIGAGRVGLSLALDLATSLHFDRVTVVGRAAVAPPLLDSRVDLIYRALRPGSLVPEPASLELTPETSLLFCVADDDLHRTAAAWSKALSAAGSSTLHCAVHTSGLHRGEALAPLRNAGAAVASWHPIVSLAGPRRGAFRLVTFGVEGDPDAVAWARNLGSLIGARSVRVRPGSKPLYHLAAVFGSNYLVACLAVASRELAASLEGEEEARSGGEASQATRAALEGGGRDAALRHLLPLARSALDNLEGAGLVAGATGPVTRGDVGTIREHLAALDPTGRKLYRLLAAELFRLHDTGLTEDVRASMGELLGWGVGREMETPPEDGSAEHDK